MGLFGGIASFLSGSGDIKKAGRIRQEGFGTANTTLQGGFDDNLALLQPLIDQDSNVRLRLQDLVGLNGQDASQQAVSEFQNSPGFNMALDRGVQAIDRSASAAGNRFSGATLKALNSYGRGLQNQDFANHFNRLSSLQNPSAINNLASLRNNLTTNIANNQIGAAGARADAKLQAGNATRGLLGQGLSLAGRAAGQFLTPGTSGYWGSTY